MLQRIVYFMLLFLIPLFADLQNDINSIVDGSTIKRSAISISIANISNKNRPLYEINENIPRIPASVMKLPTTLSALYFLGKDFRWQTQILYSANLSRDGILHGDLIIKAGGDPDFKTQDVADIVAKLKLKGLRGIDGNIIIDRDYFEPYEKSSAYFDENPYSPYNALPDAMMFNENTTTLTVQGCDVYRDVDDASYAIENNLHVVNESCNRSNSWPSAKIVATGQKPKIILSGNISTKCPPVKLTNIITKSYLACYNSFKQQLTNSGISFNGRLVLSTTPADAIKITTHYSKRLLEIIAKTNKDSNNLFARQIFLTLGAQMYGPSGTLAKSRKAIKSILSKQGITNLDGLVVDNGSGLSRNASATTSLYEDLLTKAYGSFGEKWLYALAISGVDGTIKTRFPSYMKNRVFMKTGTLKNAKNIAGYVKSKDGNLYLVAIFVNDTRASSAGFVLQNSIIKRLYEGKSVDVPTTYCKDDIKEPAKQSHTTAVATTKAGYYIQVGSFTSATTQIEENLKTQSLTYKIVDDGDMKKILVGPYASKENARAILQDIQKEINKDAFILIQ